MPACKQTTNLLSCAGVGNSYTNVCRETKKIADYARNDSSLAPATIPKGKSTPVTTDNSDGRQQTLTRIATHHTNSKIYVPRLVIYPAEESCLFQRGQVSVVI